MTQAEEEVDRGDEEGEEGDETEREGERGGGLLVASLTPPGEEDEGTAGLLLKPEDGVRSMGQEVSGRSQRDRSSEG